MTEGGQQLAQSAEKEGPNNETSFSGKWGEYKNHWKKIRGESGSEGGRREKAQIIKTAQCGDACQHHTLFAPMPGDSAFRKRKENLLKSRRKKPS